jgi:hypothetical protein
VISGEFDGAADHARRLRGLAAQIVDLRPFWPIVGQMVRGWFGEQFATEGAWGGQAWAPLAPATVAARGSAHPILVETSALKRAATAPHLDAGADYAEFTIEDPKAEWHQWGTPRMPARPVVPPTIPAIAQHQLQIEADRYFSTVARRWGF